MGADKQKRIGIPRKTLNRVESRRKETGRGRRGARSDGRSPQVAAFIDGLIEARKAKGLGPSELAERSGVGYLTISKLEKDDSSPRIDTLERLAEALDMELRLKLVKKGKR